ncbi:SRA stem-loop-interacting RNA-binding protein, mitochondrial-like [Trichogramma pretiosum]|uniref:SRA stem-loop-interacting RNA-binding protein, mitochondrial-like n=1 Tax=Trichogramma pretiosum TaxID=7493 RepID=UPI0006C96A83|nr:SRA stem-loop-interacting RNA-binding protein, mitochondrial-like [Trichogramma pretiosum]
MASRGVARLRETILYVSNIPWTIGNNELKNYFTQFGKVMKVNVVFDKNTGFHRGYGFVSLKDSETTQTILQKSRHILDGKPIEVKAKEH